MNAIGIKVGCFRPAPQDCLPDSHFVYFLMDVPEHVNLATMLEEYGMVARYTKDNDDRILADMETAVIKLKCTECT